MRSIFWRSRRTKTSTVRSRWVSRRPQTFCSSSSRVTTRPRSSASCVEQPELGRRQARRSPSDVRLHLARVDQQLLDLDRLAARLLRRADAAAGGGADAGDELAHRERLDQVVVGADLEGVDAVVLGAARGDDDDRRRRSPRRGRLDQLPAVEPGQHQVEHAASGFSKRSRARPDLAAPDHDRVEPRGAEVTRHAMGDHLVVLDDQDLRHRYHYASDVGSTG